MSWVILVIAGLFEIGWAVGLKYVDGLSRPWALVGVALSMAASVGLLGVATREIPVGTAYAVWVGVGAVGTLLMGIALFDEPLRAGRLASAALIVAGVIGLRLF